MEKVAEAYLWADVVVFAYAFLAILNQMTETRIGIRYPERDSMGIDCHAVYPMRCPISSSPEKTLLVSQRHGQRRLFPIAIISQRASAKTF